MNIVDCKRIVSKVVHAGRALGDMVKFAPRTPLRDASGRSPIGSISATYGSRIRGHRLLIGAIREVLEGGLVSDQTLLVHMFPNRTMLRATGEIILHVGRFPPMHLALESVEHDVS